MTGVEHIQTVLPEAKAANRAVFMPYHAMGSQPGDYARCDSGAG